MKLTQIRKYAGEKGVNSGKMKKVELIRAIQAAEGNPTCYGGERKSYCPEKKCLWEIDCKKEH
ncbi:MAG TPA: SAP domain-containing protein [Patescibacteria group bacterium]|nr:SAP domain-containing protein [Patescibacteria group bacterium]